MISASDSQRSFANRVYYFMNTFKTTSCEVFRSCKVSKTVLGKIYVNSWLRQIQDYDCFSLFRPSSTPTSSFIRRWDRQPCCV